MLEIIYRIYRKRNALEMQQMTEAIEKEGVWYPISEIEKEEIAMDVMQCETRDHFKDVIRELYGKNIKFAYSKNIQPDEYYCIIIGDHAYDTEKYFNRIEYECDYCHSKVKGFSHCTHYFSDWEIKQYLAGDSTYAQKRFCSSRCQMKYKEEETKKIYPDGNNDNLFITRDSFTNKYAGYIYKITKKSTGEFYVGQTIYAPVFRWAQHLKTERFKIDNILDYKFETIEIVPSGQNILEREKYWIQKCYMENPKLSLNISGTHNIDLQYKIDLGE